LANQNKFYTQKQVTFLANNQWRRERGMCPGQHCAESGIWRGIRKFGFWQISVCTAERIRLEYASAAWDPFTARDIMELDKVQHWSACFVKNNYKWSKSVSQLTSELGWQPLDQSRRNARLTLFYKSIHGANSIPVHHLQQPMRHTRQCGTHTFTPLSSRTNAYKYSYFPRTVVDWNALPDSARSAPSTDSREATPVHNVRPRGFGGIKSHPRGPGAPRGKEYKHSIW